MARILIVDDERDNLVLLREILSHAGHTVYPLMRANNIQHEIKDIKPDLVVLDLLLPGITGGSAYEMIRETVSQTLPIIISSGTKIKLRRKGDEAIRYCPKPLDIGQFLTAVEELLTQDRENKQVPASSAEQSGDEAADLDL